MLFSCKQKQIKDLYALTGVKIGFTILFENTKVFDMLYTINTIITIYFPWFITCQTIVKINFAECCITIDKQLHNVNIYHFD